MWCHHWIRYLDYMHLENEKIAEKCLGVDCSTRSYGLCLRYPTVQRKKGHGHKPESQKQVILFC